MQSVPTEIRAPRAAPLSAGDHRSFVVFATLLVIALLLLARPYIGLRHDGELYLAQVLLQWRPDVMSQDIFFQFGSQDRYSIVAKLLAGLYRHVDLATAQIVFVLLTQVATLLIVLALARRAGMSAVESTLALAAVCVMSHNYGGWSIFSFSERYVTGRTFAEPLALLGLWAIAIPRRVGWLGGGALLAGAALMHPLVSLPALAVAWGILVQRDRRWGWAVLVFMLPLGLAAAGKAPFAALFQTYDAEWWKAVGEMNGQVFVTTWPLEDWLALAFDLAVVVAGARAFAPLAPLLRAVAAATVALVLVSLLGADLLHDVLLTQLQLWRVHWITHLLSLALLPVLLYRVWRRDDLFSQLVVLAAMAAAVAINVRDVTATGTACWAGLALWLYRAQPPIDPRLLRITRGVAALVLFAVGAIVLFNTANMLAQARERVLEAQDYALLAATLPALSLPLALAALHAQRSGSVLTWGLTALLAVAGAFGIAHWDQRSPWIRHVESSLYSEHPFERLMPPAAQVFWLEKPVAVWAVLHRPSYVSVVQGAGLLFNRGTAIEHTRRSQVVGGLMLQKQVCELMDALEANASGASCWPTMPVVEEACAAGTGLDYLVLERKLERGAIAEWTFDADPAAPMTYYLHDCKQIR